MLYDSILEMVGNTPIVRFQAPIGPSVDFYVKLEGCNPTGSLKDRAALAIIKDKIKTGELGPGKTFLDASSGSYACALSLFGQVLGFPVLTVTGSTLTKEKAEFIDYFGARQISHGDITIEGNRYCKNVILPQDPEKYCFLDQLHNPQNMVAHYEGTGPEILKDLPDVAAVASSVGSGGTISGVSKFLKENKPDTKIIAVTAESGTRIPGTGAFVDGDYVTPFINFCYEEKFFDHVARVTTGQAYEQVAYLRKQGIFVGLQSGGVLQGLINGIKQLKIEGKVLLISGDSGWKGMDVLVKNRKLGC